MNYFGNNSGYVGFSRSRRAVVAESEGKFPKTKFKSEYNITEKAVSALIKVGVISDSEWHHTSMYGNRTSFLAWEESYFADVYAENKKEIDKLSRAETLDFATLEKFFETAREKENAEWAKRQDALDARWQLRAEFDKKIAEISKGLHALNRELFKKILETAPAETLIFFSGNYFFSLPNYDAKASRKNRIAIHDETNFENLVKSVYKDGRNEILAAVKPTITAALADYLPQKNVLDAKKIAVEKEFAIETEKLARI